MRAPPFPPHEPVCWLRTSHPYGEKMRGIRFDDIDGLREMISEDFGEFGPPIEVTQEMIDRFADLTDDPQWIHVDVERAARESPFGTTIAHGFFVLSLLPALTDGSDFEIGGTGMMINYGADYLRFVSPVPEGSKIHLRRHLVDVAKRAMGTLLTHESEIHVVGADKPAIVYRHLTLLVPSSGENAASANDRPMPHGSTPPMDEQRKRNETTR